jgi:hypothetical protein
MIQQPVVRVGASPQLLASASRFFFHRNNPGLADPKPAYLTDFLLRAT